MRWGGDEQEDENEEDDVYGEYDNVDDDYHASSELVLIRYLYILSAHKKWVDAVWI